MQRCAYDSVTDRMRRARRPPLLGGLNRSFYVFDGGACEDLSCCRKAICAHFTAPTLVAVWREIRTASRIVKFTTRAAWFRKKHREEDSSSQKVL